MKQDPIIELLKRLALTEQEVKVLILRFGLQDGYPKIRKEIAAKLKVSIPRIQQIELKAIRKLRHPNRLMYIRDFFYEIKLRKEKTEFLEKWEWVLGLKDIRDTSF
jgi:RNA polymerase primary sigma factor